MKLYVYLKKSIDMFIGTVGPDGSSDTHTLEELMGVDLVGQRRIILQLSLPPLPDNVFVRTIKVRRGRETVRKEGLQKY